MILGSGIFVALDDRVGHCARNLEFHGMDVVLT
jgi:hypothetical protein